MLNINDKSKAILKPTGTFDGKWAGNVLGMAALASKQKSEFKKRVANRSGQDSYDREAIKAMLRDKAIAK